MNNYIIILILFCLIIYLYFKYLKKHKIENYDVLSNSTDILQNLTNLYIDPSIPITFNEINAEYVTAEDMNGYPIPYFTPVDPINDGSIMRLGDKQRGNGWKNYTVNTPSYFSMTFSATTNTIIPTEKNLLQKNSYEQSDIKDYINLFTFESNIDSSSNKFITFYAPFDESNRKTGLRFDAAEGAITGFNPNKLYKIDCSITFYGTQVDDNWFDISVRLKNKDRIISESILAAHHEVGMTHGFRLTNTCTGITWEGIKIFANLFHGETIAIFWGYNDPRGVPNTQIAIFVEEVRKGL